MIRVNMACPCGQMMIPVSISGRRKKGDPPVPPTIIRCPLPHCKGERVIQR